MSIILRTLKGSALTYEEMDRNLSQYFYSSSVHSSGTELRLHYTGSDTLDTVTEDYGPDRYHSITIGAGSATGVTRILTGSGVTISPSNGTGVVTISSTGAGASPGGSDGSIQFNNSSVFGGDSKLFYNDTSYLVGINTNNPSNRLHILGDTKNSATLRLESATTGTTKFAQTLLYNGTTQIGAIGKIKDTETNTYISTYSSNKIHFEYNSKKIATIDGAGLGIGREEPNRPLVVVGANGIGIQKSAGEDGTTPQSILQPIPQSVFNSSVISSDQVRGLFISPPLSSAEQSIYGGHVVVSLNTTNGQPTDSNSFSIIRSRDQGYNTASSIATFRADDTVGIALSNGVAPATTLDVNGQIRGAYYPWPDDTTSLSLDTKKVVKVSYTTNKTLTSSAGAAGVEAVLILTGKQGDGVDPIQISFGSNFYIQTPGSITITDDTTYTMSFVCDGTNWYETSRTAALTNGVIL